MDPDPTRLRPSTPPAPALLGWGGGVVAAVPVCRVVQAGDLGELLAELQGAAAGRAGNAGGGVSTAGSAVELPPAAVDAALSK